MERYGHLHFKHHCHGNQHLFHASKSYRHPSFSLRHGLFGSTVCTLFSILRPKYTHHGLLWAHGMCTVGLYYKCCCCTFIKPVIYRTSILCVKQHLWKMVLLYCVRLPKKLTVLLILAYLAWLATMSCRQAVRYKSVQKGPGNTTAWGECLTMVQHRTIWLTLPSVDDVPLCDANLWWEKPLLRGHLATEWPFPRQNQLSHALF